MKTSDSKETCSKIYGNTFGTIFFKKYPIIWLDIIAIISIVLFCIFVDQFNVIYCVLPIVLPVIIYCLNYKSFKNLSMLIVFPVFIVLSYKCMHLFSHNVHQKYNDSGCYVTTGRVIEKGRERGSSSFKVLYTKWNGKQAKKYFYVWDKNVYRNYKIGDSIIIYDMLDLGTKYIPHPSDFLMSKYRNGLFVCGKHFDSLEIAEDDIYLRERFCNNVSSEQIDNNIVFYSKKYPDYFYRHKGYNIVNKAVYDGSFLRFTALPGKQCAIKYTPKNYTSIPDTFLVFHNINENIDDRFTVCAPEVNTPENWAKISDYGYIFHYDVYSKEEIESQCPQIRNYVEKYKERNIEK